MKLPWLLISRGIGQLGSATPPDGPSTQETILGDRRLQRSIGIGPPVGDQAVEADRVDHRARQDMRADFRALFDDHHRNIGVELFQPDRRRQARRAGADDDDVEIHRFAGGRFGFDGHSCSLGHRAMMRRKKPSASWIGRLFWTEAGQMSTGCSPSPSRHVRAPATPESAPGASGCRTPSRFR